METVEHLIKSVGRDTFANSTGYSQQVISRAISENLMPAGWYLDVRRVCKAHGIAVPEHLFRWVSKRKTPEQQTAPTPEAG